MYAHWPPIPGPFAMLPPPRARVKPACTADVATPLSALETHGGRKGVASLCIGGGEAVELVD